MLASKLPFGGISETGMNAALAMIEAAAPRDEIEGALAVQMACTHAAAMSLLANLGMSNSERRIACMASAAARLLRAYAMQVEALRRLRGKGEQVIRVEHFHVHEGGQAIVGTVELERDIIAQSINRSSSLRANWVARPLQCCPAERCRLWSEMVDGQFDRAVPQMGDRSRAAAPARRVVASCRSHRTRTSPALWVAGSRLAVLRF